MRENYRRPDASPAHDHYQPAEDAKPDGPDRLWVSDITYVPLIGGFV